MFKIYYFSLALILISIFGCARQPTLYPLEGASVDNVAVIARIREGSLLLRGLDRKALDTSKIPNPFSDFIYAVTPGSHVLWGMNIPGGHLLAPEGLRCYVIPDVNLEAGVIYRLDENKERSLAIIKREDTGAEIATGRIVDRKAAFTEGCKWDQPPVSDSGRR
jgi:hypothetical protein